MLLTLAISFSVVETPAKRPNVAISVVLNCSSYHCELSEFAMFD